MTACYCNGGDKHEHRPHGGGARIMACPWEPVKLEDLRESYRPGNGDALSNRAAEPGSPEYDYMHRYDSPDNERDSMG